METTMDDRSLVSLAQQGDGEAFACLVERHQKMVYNLALGQTGNHHDAEEITQAAFLKAWQGLPKFQGRAAFSSWLYRLTFNAATDFLRKKSRRPRDLSLEDPGLSPLPHPGPSPEDRSALREDRQVLWQSLEALPPPLREILLLREVEGLSYQELALALDLEEGTVRSRLFRARKSLRKLLLEHENFRGRISSNPAEGKGGDPE